MTKTVADGARQLVSMGKLLPEAQREALKKAATVAKDVANRTGGHMRHMGRRGANLTASYSLSQTQATLKPRPLGAWHIAESGAGAHLIGVGRGKRRKVGGFIKAAGYSHPVRSPIAHPGARGRLVWTRTVKEAERIVPPIFNQTVIKGSLKRVFG